ncbi:hypothetical protein NX862_16760 [Rhodobacter sp. KR11]|uniref:hypothetical protein n=1 Tax=Rhodobacter sp. KR11 TaxID=2974588 RepID=UPI00222381B0|nr:hypothetical protein [Rhodobacter sp. KR11]MCW1920415.1 hypothetical protein [Rhodobacter sp. KR11]
MRLTLACLLTLSPLPVLAQEVDLSWLMEAHYAAISTTSESVTGDIDLSAEDWVWTVDFQGGASLDASFVEQRSSAWMPGDGEVWAGAVLAVEEDPGELENGNTICGEDEASFIVFTPIDAAQIGAELQIAVFSGETPPENIEDPSLCGTYNYAIR